MLSATEFARLYSETYGVTIKDATTYCDSVFTLLGKTLYEDRKGVGIYGFGSFTPTVTAPRRNKHPVTGEITIIQPKNIVKFRQAGKTIS